MGDALTATARARRMGRTVAVADIDVFDEKNSLVAIGRGTYFPKAG
ncbi:MAG: hotdog domain-containing protein [Alphaproteobacteria bacterium]